MIRQDIEKSTSEDLKTGNVYKTVETNAMKNGRGNKFTVKAPVEFWCCSVLPNGFHSRTPTARCCIYIVPVGLGELCLFSGNSIIEYPKEVFGGFRFLYARADLLLDKSALFLFQNVS
jgi:hypothetical protein